MKCECTSPLLFNKNKNQTEGGFPCGTVKEEVGVSSEGAEVIYETGLRLTGGRSALPLRRWQPA